VYVTGLKFTSYDDQVDSHFAPVIPMYAPMPMFSFIPCSKLAEIGGRVEVYAEPNNAVPNPIPTCTIFVPSSNACALAELNPKMNAAAINNFVSVFFIVICF
jgi:hypothetical protein